jgi:peptide deformylase
MIHKNALALEVVTIEETIHAPVLREEAQLVAFPLSSADLELISAMKEKLYHLGGVGLAAPQVNYSKRIIAIYIPAEAALLRDNVLPYPMHIMINPSYQGIEQEGFSQDLEGCYSVSSKAGQVSRYNQIALHYYDENGQAHNSVANGFYARVLQHEIDHINGTLITDRLTPDCIQGSVEEMMALRRKGLSDEQKAAFDLMINKKFKNK